MGSSKPTPYEEQPVEGAASSSSSHPLQPYGDVDDDLPPPPAYTEEDTTTPSRQKPTQHPPLPDPANYFLPDSVSIKSTRPETRITSCFPRFTTPPETPSPSPASTTTHHPRARHTTLTFSPSLSTDPSALYSLLLTQSRLPPHLSIWVKGTHFEKRGRGSVNSKHSEEVIDFKFRIDVGGSLLRGWDLDDEEGNKEWRRLKVVRDGDGESAWRGGRVKSRGERTSGRVNIGTGTGFEGETDLEALMTSDEESSTDLEALQKWCHRFCSSDSNHPSMRTFTLTRDIQNWDFPTVKSSITSLIRSLNYRGRISVTTDARYHSLKIQTPHPLNRARANPFIWWFCVIFQLWIITWPIILLLEQKYEVARSEWFVSRPDTSSYDPSALTHSRTFARGRGEKEWVEEYWAAAIKEAALTRRKDGEVVGEGDVRRLARDGGDGVENLRRAEMEADWERRRRVATGDGSWRDMFVSVWRGFTGRGREEWDQVRGWGADC